MAVLKQSTVYSRKFKMVLTSDHVTGATGKTITAFISKGPGAVGTTPAGTITELDSTNLPGVYQIAYTAADTAVLGDLTGRFTATSCDQTTTDDQVQVHLVSDITLDSNGNVSTTSNVKQDQALGGFTFPMTIQGVPTPGLVVTASKYLNGVGPTSTSNSVVEIGLGLYKIDLTASDLNATLVTLRFTASGADDRIIDIPTQP